MARHHLLTTSRIFIVAGKGGVGKSTVAGALALVAARSGMPTVLVGLGPEAHHVPAHDLLATVAVSPGKALADYLASRGLGVVSRQLAQSGIVELVASTAPGIDDLLVLGKIKSLAKEKPDHVIIVDGPAAGHALDMLRSPAELRRAVGGGPIRQQADDVLAMLADPSMSRLLLVTTPAITPVHETIEAAREVQDDVRADIACTVVNMCDDSPPPVAVDELPPRLRAVWEYASARAAAQETARRLLDESLHVPQIWTSRHRRAGADLVAAVADDIEAGLLSLDGQR